jgi:anthranilate 1,2-dioxygenase small subunit
MSEHRPVDLIDALQMAYVRALDKKDMKSWLACFSPESAYYECSTLESESQCLILPLMLDDCYARLKDRILFVDEVWSGTFTDYATRHFIQRTSVSDSTTNLFTVETNFMVAYTTDRRNSEILAAGRYEDEVAIAGSRALFVKKRAILDTITTPRYLVYPL